MKKLIAISLVIGFMGYGCTTSDPDPKPETEVQELTIKIDHTINGSPIDYIKTEYTLGAGTVVKITRLSYILSNFFLEKSDGSKIEFEDHYALIEAHRDYTQLVLPNVPKGSYKSIGFSIGLDSAVNHADPNQYDVNHPLSPINNALHWNWTAGYIFIAVEGRLASNNNSYVYHLAGDVNRVDYNFPLTFSKEAPALTASMEFEYEEIFENPNMFDMEVSGMSAHSETGPVTTALIENIQNAIKLIKVE
ncbi:MAG: hypothetical protein JXR19_07005 [Bacteroidia bacterium]